MFYAAFSKSIDKTFPWIGIELVFEEHFFNMIFEVKRDKMDPKKLFFKFYKIILYTSS